MKGLKIDDLEKIGFKSILNEIFKYDLKEEKIAEFRKMCNEKTIVCVGASKKETHNVLELCGIDYGIEAF